jgi:hypothetical protein
MQLVLVTLKQHVTMRNKTASFNNHVRLLTTLGKHSSIDFMLWARNLTLSLSILLPCPFLCHSSNTISKQIQMSLLLVRIGWYD